MVIDMIEPFQKLQNLFTPLNEIDASFKASVVATHFLDTTNVYIPKNPFDKLRPGMHLIEDAKRIRKYKKWKIEY